MGELTASSDEARDALFHYFQDAYPLNDWIKNDPAVSTGDVEQFINEVAPLQICADLCNGTKHLALNRPRTGDSSTGFTSQNVAVRPSAIGSGLPADPALHGWTVESKSKSHQAVDLTDRVVTEWQDWLGSQGLI